MAYLEKEKEIEWDLREKPETDGGRSKRRPRQQDRRRPNTAAGGVPKWFKSSGARTVFQELWSRPTELTESDTDHNARRSFDLRSLPLQLAPPSRAAFFRLFRDAHTLCERTPHSVGRAHSSRGLSFPSRIFCRFRESALARTLASTRHFVSLRDLNEQAL